MKSVIQPGEQARFGRGKVDAGHTDAGKSQLAGPLPYLGQQQRTLTLTAAERHLPIIRAEVWRNEEDTRVFAARLAAAPAIAGAVIELHGELGAGKTTLVRHLLRALGVQGRIKSPTYAVVEPYDNGRFAIWHFDFYRFGDPREWEDAGLRDIFAAPGLKISEWPEKAAGMLPQADLVIRIEADADETRRVALKAQTPRGQELLA